MSHAVFCLDLLGVFAGGIVLCHSWICAGLFGSFFNAVPLFAVSLKLILTGLSVIKVVKKTRDDVLPKSNSEGHRCPGLCSGNGDTAGEVQKERFPGRITGGPPFLFLLHSH